MKNFDLIKTTLATQRQDVVNALKSGDEAEQETAFNGLFAGIQESVMSEAESFMEKYGNDMSDERILSDRGLQRALTSQEKKFFNAVVDKGTFEGVEDTFPMTIISDVFKNLTTEHPLLSRVDAVATGALMKYVYADPTTATAYWGRVPDDIKQILINTFKSINLETSKLSGFVAMPKGFFKLGPSWLAQYIVTILQEIMQATLEVAVIDGTGKDQPIGMTRQLNGAIDGAYPAKAMITISDFSAETLAGIHAALAKAKTDNGRVAMLVNPQTYWAKVFPKLAFQDQQGVWKVTGLVTGDEIIQSHAVPEDKLIFGVPENYFLGIAGDVEIKKYEETLAIEDMDVFIAKFFGNGVAKNKDAFFIGDIALMAGATVPDLEAAVDIEKTNNIGTKTP